MAVVDLWEIVKTKQYPTKDKIITNIDKIIFLSVGNILSYLKACTNP